MAGGKKRFLSRKNEVKDFCAHTSAHGLGQAAAASSWKTRILWLLIFISSFIVAATQIYMTIHDFLQYPTQTEVTLVTKERLAFPGVTICNLNPVTRANIINSSLWRNIEDFEAKSTNKSFENPWRVGHQGEDFITSCIFPGTGHINSCSHKDFSQFFDMEYGNCFTINTSNLFVQRSGHQEGFKVTLFIDAAEYVGPLADSVGAVVSVYLPLTKSNTMGENPIYVAPGSFVSVSLNAQYISRLDYPYNKEHCKQSSKHNQWICLRECIVAKIKQDCGCVSMDLHGEPLCDPLNETSAECIEKSRLKIKFDACPCHPNCKEFHFLTGVSSPAWPSKEHMPMLSGLLNKTGTRRVKEVVKDLESARKNMAQVNIHYASMTVEHIDQKKAMTFAALVGAIGGQLGLCIGVSIITLVEFLALLWRLIRPSKKLSNEVEDINHSGDINKQAAENK